MWFSTAGAGTTVLAFFFMRSFNLQTHPLAILPVLILLGLGIGMFQPPNNSTIMGSVARDRLGTASALIATQRSVGISLGMAIAGTAFSLRKIVHLTELIRRGLDAGHATKLALTLAFHDVLVLAIGISSFVVVLSLIAAKESNNRP
jgi:hypothetical protein